MSIGDCDQLHAPLLLAFVDATCGPRSYSETFDALRTILPKAIDKLVAWLRGAHAQAETR
jgi:hypothetical protein